METKFIFTEKNGGACVTEILSPGAVCIVPESLGGACVTEIGDRCFAGSPVEEVYLPRTLKRIGRYGFYNCEHLRAIHIYAETMEIGGGIPLDVGSDYDKLFVYEKAEEPVTAAAEIAMYRLWYPHGLWEDAKKAYEDFLQQHLYEVLAGNMGKPDCFKRLFGEYAGRRLTEEETDRLISEASKRKLAEISGILMDYKHRSFQLKKKKFEL